MFESVEKKKIVMGALPNERSFLYQVHQVRRTILNFLLSYGVS